ncbi:MAG: hypothetical protein WCJ81_09520 [bacterium]
MEVLEAIVAMVLVSAPLVVVAVIVSQTLKVFVNCVLVPVIPIPLMLTVPTPPVPCVTWKLATGLIVPSQTSPKVERYIDANEGFSSTATSKGTVLALLANTDVVKDHTALVRIVAL